VLNHDLATQIGLPSHTTEAGELRYPPVAASHLRTGRDVKDRHYQFVRLRCQWRGRANHGAGRDTLDVLPDG